MTALTRLAVRFGLAAVLTGLLVGCSLVGIAYNSADQWLLRRADDYLDLGSGQRDGLRAALRDRLATHRARELAEYVDFLDRVQVAAKDGLDAAEVEALLARLEGLVRTTVGGTLPAIAGVLATLEPAQVDHLEVVLKDDDRRYRKRFVQPTAHRVADRRAESAVRAIEHWTGRLTAAQRERVEEMVGTWPVLAQEWDQYRTARTTGLLELLRGRPDADVIAGYLASRWLTHDGHGPALAAGAGAMRAGVVALLVAVDHSLTQAQRAAFLKRVRDYRQDLADLLPSADPAVAGVGATVAAR